MTVVLGGAEFPAYVFDPDTLREELLDEDEAREWVVETPDDPHAVAFLRMLGELDAALVAGTDRLLEHDPGTQAWASAAVRLAQVHHWRGEYADAHDLLDAAEEIFVGDDARTALVRQHRSVALFDEGRLGEALALAQQAVELRERSGEAGLVTISQQTVERIARQLG